MLVNSANQRSTLFSQELDVGVKCSTKRGWATSQRLIAGVLWVGLAACGYGVVEADGSKAEAIVGSSGPAVGVRPELGGLRLFRWLDWARRLDRLRRLDRFWRLNRP